mmetsp:Transcript_35082/g.31609  ORF Transcript_35082/g.31609 Transcript_35082/m.31609 type:complete len:204 (+) Transcript_35082:43-654(+)
MSIFEYNGGAIVAMKGKNCIAIACDRRLGVQLQTISTNFQKVFKMQDNLLLGLTGLGSDIQTFHALMEYKLNLYTLKENREMKPQTFANLIATSLYEKRFGPYFVTPIVAGLQNGTPVLATYDSIGCISDSDPFQVGGTASDSLLGAAETLYKKDMEAEELVECCAQTLLAGMDRDILSGWGGVAYLLTEEGIKIKTLKTKQT